jgi:hypothetical protein
MGEAFNIILSNTNNTITYPLFYPIKTINGIYKFISYDTDGIYICDLFAPRLAQNTVAHTLLQPAAGSPPLYTPNGDLYAIQCYNSSGELLTYPNLVKRNGANWDLICILTGYVYAQLFIIGYYNSNIYLYDKTNKNIIIVDSIGNISTVSTGSTNDFYSGCMSSDGNIYLYAPLLATIDEYSSAGVHINSLTVPFTPGVANIGIIIVDNYIYPAMGKATTFYRYNITSSTWENYVTNTFLLENTTTAYYSFVVYNKFCVNTLKSYIYSVAGINNLAHFKISYPAFLDQMLSYILLRVANVDIANYNPNTAFAAKSIIRSHTTTTSATEVPKGATAQFYLQAPFTFSYSLYTNAMSAEVTNITKNIVISEFDAYLVSNNIYPSADVKNIITPKRMFYYMNIINGFISTKLVRLTASLNDVTLYIYLSTSAVFPTLSYNYNEDNTAIDDTDIVNILQTIVDSKIDRVKGINTPTADWVCSSCSSSCSSSSCSSSCSSSSSSSSSIFIGFLKLIKNIKGNK